LLTRFCAEARQLPQRPWSRLSQSWPTSTLWL